MDSGDDRQNNSWILDLSILALFDLQVVLIHVLLNAKFHVNSLVAFRFRRRSTKKMFKMAFQLYLICKLPRDILPSFEPTGRFVQK